MRKASVLFALLLTAAMSLSALASHARTPCYRLKITLKGTVLIDKVVGLGCSQPASVDENGTTTFFIRG